MLVWYWIVGILGGMTVFTVAGFYFLAVNQIYTDVEATTNVASIQAFKEFLTTYVVTELQFFIIVTLIEVLILDAQYDSWIAAQWNAVSDSTREVYRQQRYEDRLNKESYGKKKKTAEAPGLIE